ncbi:PAAR domain-containing protein [Massilia scottii]|uniref:PAAR domain-containing protein n=1 Tax=Massilia scottii TaxID=3057166 RepID=UPI004043444A
MPQAARITDPIGHSPTMSWLLAGLLAGAAIAIAAVAIVGTGGLAAVAIVGGAAAMGAGLCEAMSTMSWAPKEVCGFIAGVGSLNVFTNKRPAARAHVDMTTCFKHAPPAPLPIATGSGTVYINGQPAARVDDTIVCSAVITSGSNNVYIGGGTQKTDDIFPEDLVPGWVHGALLVVGLGSAIVLAGPFIAVAGLAGGIAGGIGGDWLGGEIFGEGSDGQKWSALGGSVIGGLLGAKGGSTLANKVIPKPLSETQGFLKGGLGGMKEAAQNRAALAKELSEARVDAINNAPKTDFENGRKPVKASTVVDKRTGKVYQEDSGYPLPKTEDIHPTLRERMPKPSLEEAHVPENCAEFKAANKALKDGARMEDLEMYTINRQKGGAPRCANCMVTTKGAHAITDH